MQISTPTRVLLGGAAIALLIYGAGQMMARELESKPSALDTDPRLRALASECEKTGDIKTGDIYDAIAKHYGASGYRQDGTPVELKLNTACDKLWRLWDQIEPWTDPVAKPDQPKTWTQYASDWAPPVAAFVLALSALPWLWYFILRRIRELRDAIIGK